MTQTNQQYKNRQDQLIRRARDAGIERLMICEPVNLLYFTGIKITPYERFVAFLLDTGSGRGRLVLPGLERDAAKGSGIPAKFYSDHEDPFLLVMEQVSQCRLTGVEKKSLPLFAAERILAGSTLRPDQKPGPFLSDLADITGMISDIRLCKDETELASLAMAAQYSDEILDEISAKITVGRTEKEITVEIMQAMAKRPGLMIHDFVIQVLVGKGSADPHGYAADRRLKKGDPATIDFGVCYEHYWSDCTRTFFAGPPKPQFKEIYQIVWEAQQAAIDKVGPGVPMAEIDRAARQVIDAAGYGEYFIHRIGHGIGLSIHELPSLHSRNRSLLEKGMVITIEPGIYLPGLGGVRIEEDVVVTAHGAKVLTHYPNSFTDMVL